MTDDLDLAHALTDTISGVPGVTGVYPTGSLARSIARDLVDVARDERDAQARVAVTRDPLGALRVEATVGIAAGRPVPDVLRAVGDAVRGVLGSGEPGAPQPVIEVRASHIDTSSLGTRAGS